MRQNSQARVRYEDTDRDRSRRRKPVVSDKKKGLNPGTFIMVLVAIGVVLYFLSA